MTKSYIQYAAGYQKEDVNEADITHVLTDIQAMDEEHGAFWISVTTDDVDDENVIEVDKNISLSIISGGKVTKYQALKWEEVEKLLTLLLEEDFEEIKARIK